MIEMASQVDISKALSIGGWMSKNELTWLANQAEKRKLIVEFGSFHGRSTRALADNNFDGRIWAVDIWNVGQINNDLGQSISTYSLPYFLNNLKDHIETGHVIPIRNFSSNFTLPFKVDMVFIDADHTYEGCRKDILQAMKLLKPNGLLCGHDYGDVWPEVRKVVDRFFPDVELMDTIWYTTKF